MILEGEASKKEARKKLATNSLKMSQDVSMLGLQKKLRWNLQCFYMGHFLT